MLTALAGPELKGKTSFFIIFFPWSRPTKPNYRCESIFNLATIAKATTHIRALFVCQKFTVAIPIFVVISCNALTTAALCVVITDIHIVGNRIVCQNAFVALCPLKCILFFSEWHYRDSSFLFLSRWPRTWPAQRSSGCLINIKRPGQPCSGDEESFFFFFFLLEVALCQW